MAVTLTPTEHRPKVYVCGKITGLEEAEVVAKFARCCASLLHDGFEPVNPVQLVAKQAAHCTDVNWGTAMGIVVPELLQCEGIYIQQDWQSSEGSIIEILMAKRQGMFLMVEDIRQLPLIAELKVVL